MSWEVSGQTEHRCPCGKGIWVEISESDDWLRSRSHAEIRCPKCKETHRIREVCGYDKGLPVVSYEIVGHTATPEHPRRK